MNTPGKMMLNKEKRRDNLIEFLRTHYIGLKPTEAAKALDDDLYALYREEPLPWGIKRRLFETTGRRQES